MSDNKRIAKNTIFLYIRMFLIMGVTLYASRVILDKLGVEDFGLYNVVGGVVGMLSFLSGTLSIGTTRFITFELGNGSFKRLKETFCTSFYAHLGLAIIMILILESVGLWFVYNKLIIPVERFDAALIVYHISISTLLVSITQTPYTAEIMAHERMDIYAYISIFEAVAKLCVCILIIYSPIDKLVFYAILLAIVQILVASFYRIFCVSQFPEAHLCKLFDNAIFKEMLTFSGWNIIANIVETIKSQGIVVLMNMFFVPTIVGAQAFANQLSSSLMQFVNNFRTAINPQIIKLYAAGDYEESRKLTLSTTIYVYDLILFLGLPCILVMPKILELWLVEVPEYTCVFCQFVMVYNILSTFSAAFYVPMMASGKVRTNSIAGLIFGVGQFLLLYLILKIGGGVMWVQYLNISLAIVFGFLVKPWILIKEVSYKSSELVGCYIVCAKITLSSLLIPMVIYMQLDMSELINNILIFSITAMSVAISSLVFMDETTRIKLFSFILSKLRR